MTGDLDAQVARNREIRQAVLVLVDPEERDRVSPVRRLPPLELRVVGPEQEDVGGAAVIVVERLPRPIRKPLVRVRDAVPELEVAREPPDDEKDDEHPERDRDPAQPAPARPEVEARARVAARRRLLRLRNLPP